MPGPDRWMARAREDELSNEKSGYPGCEQPSYVGIFINDYKDPY